MTEIDKEIKILEHCVETEEFGSETKDKIKSRMKLLQNKMKLSDIRDQRNLKKGKFLIEIEELENDLVRNEKEMNLLERDINEKKNLKQVYKLRLKKLYTDLLMNPDQLL